MTEPQKYINYFKEIWKIDSEEMRIEELKGYLKAARNFYFYKKFSGSDSFSDELFYLIGKADDGNKCRINWGFPFEVQVWQEWNSWSYDERLYLEMLEERIKEVDERITAIQTKWKEGNDEVHG